MNLKFLKFGLLGVAAVVGILGASIDSKLQNQEIEKIVSKKLSKKGL